jgi:hypothetical protein
MFSVFIVIDELAGFSEILFVACVISKATYTGQIAINPMTWRMSKNFFIFIFLFDDLILQKYNVSKCLKGQHGVKNRQPWLLSTIFSSVRF